MRLAAALRHWQLSSRSLALPPSVARISERLSPRPTMMVPRASLRRHPKSRARTLARASWLWIADSFRQAPISRMVQRRGSSTESGTVSNCSPPAAARGGPTREAASRSSSALATSGGPPIRGRAALEREASCRCRLRGQPSWRKDLRQVQSQRPATQGRCSDSRQEAQFGNAIARGRRRRSRARLARRGRREPRIP